MVYNANARAPLLSCGTELMPRQQDVGPRAPSKPDATTASHRGRLLRNTLFLVLSQFVTTPLGVLVNAVLARKLGAEDFGTIYVASTMATLGFLFVDWGQQATIAGRLALKREDAAETLGTSLALKIAAVAIVSLVLMTCAWLFGYSRALFVALALTIVQQTFTSLSASYTSVMRGFERLDWVSGLTIAGNLLAAALVIPAALLGGGLTGTLTSQAAAALLALVISARTLSRLQLGRPLVRVQMARTLLHAGGGFVLFGLVLAVQPYVDAVILSRLASADSVGWYAAARRLLGVLIFPATTIGYVLYPTMTRLWEEDRPRFRRLVGTTLRLVILIGVCVSVGTFLFADFAIHVVYSRSGFGPAADDLRVLAGFVFLMYFTLLLGTTIAAAGKQMLWAAAQAMCIVVSAVGDPLLVPLCERRFGNGGLGVCLSTLISELLVLAAAMFLVRGEGLIRQLRAAVLPALAGGVAMWAAASLLRGLPTVITMAVSTVAYAAVVIALGGVDRTHLDLLRDIAKMRAARTSQPDGDSSRA